VVAAVSLVSGAVVAGIAAREWARARDRSERMVGFVLEDMIDGLDPDKTGGKQASLQEALRTGAVRAGERLGSDAELVMETLERIGRAQITLTDHLGAASTFERAAAVARGVRGADTSGRCGSSTGGRRARGAAGSPMGASRPLVRCESEW
jgi:hypothetical protein